MNFFCLWIAFQFPVQVLTFSFWLNQWQILI